MAAVARQYDRRPKEAPAPRPKVCELQVSIDPRAVFLLSAPAPDSRERICVERDPVSRPCGLPYLKFILSLPQSSTPISYHFLPGPLLGIAVKTLGSLPCIWLTPTTRTYSWLPGTCLPFRRERDPRRWSRGGRDDSGGAYRLHLTHH